MRITMNSMNRRYLTNVNKNLSDVASSNNKIASGRAFTKMSENVTKGTRALGIRSQLYRNEQIQSNAKTVREQFTVAEDNLTAVNDVLQTVHGKVIAALNGTNSQQELDIYANEFDTLREGIMQFSNCTYDDKYIFGGTNDAGQPYTLAEDGALLFNGVPVSEITEEGGVFYQADGSVVPYSEDIYLDCGLGMRFSNGQIDTRTVLNSSVSGLRSMGCGTTELVYEQDGEEVAFEAPNNVYELIGSICDALEDGDMELLGALSDHLDAAMNNTVTSITDIGVRYQFVENNIARLETEHLGLTEMKGDLEGICDTDGIMNNECYVCGHPRKLQFGSQVVPQSLMDYIR